MTRKKTLLVVLLMLALVVAGCGQASGKKNEIRVGSKFFTENAIVAEVYALALEDNGFKVSRNHNISDSVIHTALINDEIDLYPEYTGTGLIAILKMPMETDPEAVYAKVKEGYANQFSVTWLEYAPANDSQGLVIRKDKADELGIKTISDLQQHAGELRFASQGTFDMREDGLVGLKSVYGDFNWKSANVYSNDLKYKILRNNEADVAPAYTTEGNLVDKESFLVLEDDKHFWPPYNIAPIVKTKVLEENPDISKVLQHVNEKIDTETITRLNARVDLDGEDFEKVAKEFYESIK